ncbi:LacI family DNA-binding transcriptional regulator [Arthrobacter sp. NQ7]|uniref:LacI family DNA-binding transcriptional regulator n=1 Tax=Arthrobacter sp. NQ7 TaxID=3032303 RepID=UPI0024104DEF|nr:LacI family DNA-binding transcriptional regulator [Arthrobacter sp. NQ7]MDJ0458648.1 LacI family DNA-binding transcriptional regulator [Arthrobacter sp. NQ7]
MLIARSIHRPATSADVARLAGVSRSTVSNILNGNGARFQEETKQRVFDAAQELDYQPSTAGRMLKSGRSETIVVLVPNTSFGGNLQDAVDQVMVRTRQIGGNVVVRFAGDTPAATASAIAALRPLAVVDLGVLSRTERDWLEGRGIIIVPSMTGPRTSPDGGIAELQAGVLLSHRPKAVWFAALSDKRFDPYGPGRLDALLAICRREGLPDARQVAVELSVESGIQAVQTILGGPVPAGIACYNDDVALAVLAGIRELGLDVPGLLSVVGVDKTPAGQLWSPALTTIDTDLKGLVDALALELGARLGNEADYDLPATHEHFRLIRGKSA